MMQRVIISNLVLCVALLLGVLAQQNRLATLRDERARLFAQISSHAETTPPVASDKATQTSDSPSLELLKLRAEVARLSNRKRELARATEEHANLQNQLATRGTTAPGAVALPPGYIRKSEAQFAGYGTPEATIQTWLWAARTRNTAHYLQAFDPNEAKRIEAQMQSRGSLDEFFKGAAVSPGMKILGRVDGTTSVDEAALLVQVAPGEEPHRVWFRRVGGEWKIFEGL